MSYYNQPGSHQPGSNPPPYYQAQPARQQQFGAPQGHQGQAVYYSHQGAQSNDGRATYYSHGYPPPKQVFVVVPPPSSARSEYEPSGPRLPFGGTSFSNQRLRHAFIRKVYLILAVLMLITVSIICIFIFVNPVRKWVQMNAWIRWIAIAVYFVVSIVLVCCETVRRTVPWNFICLFICCLAMSCMCGVMSTFYNVKFVALAFGITTLLCVAISIFAIQTKIDFTLCSGVLFVLSFVMLLFGLSCMIVYICVGPVYILQCVYAALMALLFGLYLVYDTQVIIGGRKYELSPEEYIVGALTLYQDAAMIFLIVLSFFPGSGD